MKKIFFVLLLSCIYPMFCCAQVSLVSLDAKVLKNYKGFKKGELIHIDSIVYKNTLMDTLVVRDVYSLVPYYLYIQGQEVPIERNIKDCLDFSPATTQELWDAYIIGQVLYPLGKTGPQITLRKEMEEDALRYIHKIGETELNDAYLESYIYSLVAQIAPAVMLDNRPCNVNLFISENPDINAGIFPNGTMVITTGLLSCLHSEAELVAVLAHEIAHFVFDHAVINVNKMLKRQKQAEFWAALATGLTAVAEVAVAANNSYYIPGAATAGVAMLSSAIAIEVMGRLGMKYNHEQENEADQAAREVLQILGYDKNALATALSRMSTSMAVERSQAMYFASYTHPALVDRIKASGIPNKDKEIAFERKISFAITSAARLKFEDKRFRQALQLVQQNIANNVATIEDYLLCANCNITMFNTNESNQETLALIRLAKVVDSGNINLYKPEIIALLRLGKVTDAQSRLEEYQTALTSYGEHLREIVSPTVWEEYTCVVDRELTWAKNMQIKLRSFD